MLGFGFGLRGARRLGQGDESEAAVVCKMGCDIPVTQFRHGLGRRKSNFKAENVVGAPIESFNDGMRGFGYFQAEGRRDAMNLYITRPCPR